MKFSQLFVPTLKEDPKAAEVVSHKLLLRAGYIRKLAAGIYNYLPLGIRTVRKVEAIVREEMERAGAQEVLMPAVQPASIWQESGRWEFYGRELLRMTDRKGGEFCLGPTHEEVVTDLVRGELRSYRDMPLNLFQVQTKFRDELRPRAGLMRGREFIMKDGYSFDVDEAASKVTYQTMFDAYCRIFTRCGLDFRPVEADTGAIGGNLSHEFQVLADSGEDSIVSCPECGYTANIEKAELGADDVVAGGEAGPLTLIDTPAMRTIAELTAALEIPASALVKTVVFIADDKPVVVLIRGDLDVNEVNLKIAVGAEQVHPARDGQVVKLTGAPVGFAGPVGLEGADIWADESLRGVVGAVVGANQEDKHYTGFDLARDVPDAKFGNFRGAGAGDLCGRCHKGRFEFFSGIEVGQVFHLGTKYSEAMKATYLGEDGAEHPMVMGCYGIGITRVVAAAVEQHHDANGIIWPLSLAPFHVMILPMRDEPEIVEVAERLHDELNDVGVQTLLDDRYDLRPGVKFKDADLIGIPLRITIGPRSLKEGKVELKDRAGSETELVAVDEIVALLSARVKEAIGR